MQLVNSMKYLSKFGPPTAFYLGCSKKADVGDPNFFWFLAAQLFTTLFCLYWDFRWDWGFFIGKSPGRRFLRDEMIFSPRFYYSCMTINTIFRFWWVINLFTIKYSDSSKFMEQLGALAFISMMTEAIRRTIWSIIRVENEFFNNFEQYRDIVMIPPIRDETNDKNFE